MNTDNYLKRIKYHGSLSPTLLTLSQLQEAHVLNIPFENLDIHYGIPIDLDIQKLYNKIILSRRGGFCYELNGLFYELLIKIGFRVKRISARVFNATNGYGEEYDHMAIIANINGTEYLTDVGFGEFCFSPLKLETGIIQNDKRGDYIIQEFSESYFIVNKSEDGKLIPQYIFTSVARELDEFYQMCHYHQTSPKSHFTQNTMITKPTPVGRISLSPSKLKITKPDSTTESQIANEEIFRKLLWKYFSIKLNFDKGF